MALLQSNFSSLLEPIIQHHMDVGINMVPSLRGQLFNVQASSLYQERGTSMGGMPVDAWDVYNQTGQPGSLDLNQLYEQTYTHVEYPVRLPIEKRLLINDQYNYISRLIQRVGMSAEQKMETDAANLLNLAFSGKTWADGQELCDTDHPSGGSTQSNEGTDSLTAQSVSDTRVAMMQFTDDRGNVIGVMPDELWVPPELEDTALEIVGSMQTPDTGNNAINPQAGRFRVIPWLRLTDSNAWFMASSAWRQMAANWYTREAMQMMIVDETTTHIVYEIKLHYSWGVDDWRWIYGHNPS